MKNHPTFFLFSIVILTFLSCKIFASSSEFIIIANKSIQSTTISVVELKKAFLGEKEIWGNGQKIVVTTLNCGKTHLLFLKQVLHKSCTQFKNYWQQNIFNGQKTPPKSFLNEKELMQYVAQTPGAIGYISRQKIIDEVVVLEIE